MPKYAINEELISSEPAQFVHRINLFKPTESITLKHLKQYSTDLKEKIGTLLKEIKLTVKESKESGNLEKIYKNSRQEPELEHINPIYVEMYIRQYLIALQRDVTALNTSIDEKEKHLSLKKPQL